VTPIFIVTTYPQITID